MLCSFSIGLSPCLLVLRTPIYTTCIPISLFIGGKALCFNFQKRGELSLNALKDTEWDINFYLGSRTDRNVYEL